ncbi:patatin-like phospholipase family protein [Frankia sp. AgB1.9]|uniref:patatin-like phospholipase family protein n=1 Tax=unclassified Frankia TaxID=2632575 RepID=UPI0019335517|nr:MULTISPECIES: patatin-like phospholipase family protein [unclassified Frankia]MBL7488752.1 patatin-like phospholipase family protein [Frankia sp. AgW1.1]MBL7546567.1 patatin-like phospholipase family protein [Frankia sp. AgB1.9]MBL7625063.1 patatin-like phospholipase family protein [Frankia sp. AgB1.8]
MTAPLLPSQPSFSSVPPRDDAGPTTDARPSEAGGDRRDQAEAGDPGEVAGRVAFVFQGGGSLAAAQVGMLRALTEAGIVPDLVVGASAGALNAVAYATDPTEAGIERVAAVWTSLRRKDVAPLSLRALAGGLIGRQDGLASSTGLRHLLESGLVATRLEHTVIPAHVVTTDLETGHPLVLSEGDTVQALLATSAYPGVFPPVTVDGQRLIDGGVSADTPVLQAESLGAMTTYVLPSVGPTPGAATPEPVPHGAFALALRALNQILGNAARADMSAVHGTVYLLPAPGTTIVNPFDFRGTGALLAAGYRLTRAWLRDATPVQAPVAAAPLTPLRLPLTAPAPGLA